MTSQVIIWVRSPISALHNEHTPVMFFSDFHSTAISRITGVPMHHRRAFQPDAFFVFVLLFFNLFALLFVLPLKCRTQGMLTKYALLTKKCLVR